MSGLTDHPKNAGQPWLRTDPRDRQKPYRGKIKMYGTVDLSKWKERGEEVGLGYLYFGQFIDHPVFATKRGHTSYVVWEQPHHSNEEFDIETRNSRYTIIPKIPDTGPNQ